MSPAGSSNAPEARARARIDQTLAEAGWTLQDRDDMNLAAAPAIAVREFKLDKGHGYVDYMLFLDGHPVGVCEAKPAGTALIGVEHQVRKYVQGRDSASPSRDAREGAASSGHPFHHLGSAPDGRHKAPSNRSVIGCVVLECPRLDERPRPLIGSSFGDALIVLRRL